MSTSLSQLEMLEVLRRRAHEMHQSVDSWFLLTAHELGLQLPVAEDEPVTLGISFEPGVQVQAQLLEHESRLPLGIYQTSPGRQVEVVVCDEVGTVQFELVDSQGEVVECKMHEELFRALFATPDPAKLPG